MIVALSVIIAVILTFVLAVGLYPVAGLFWIFGLFGQLSSLLFENTTKIIKKLWQDLKGIEGGTEGQWKCACGCMNTGKFCTECGEKKVLPEKADEGKTDVEKAE